MLFLCLECNSVFNVLCGTCDHPDDARLHRRSKRYLQYNTIRGNDYRSIAAVCDSYGLWSMVYTADCRFTLEASAIAQIDWNALDSRAPTPHTEVDVRYTE